MQDPQRLKGGRPSEPPARSEPARPLTLAGGGVQRARWDRRPASSSSAHEGSPARVGAVHQRELEGAIDLLRVAFELGVHCDFGELPHGQARLRRAFEAHFPGWGAALSDWEAKVRRARAGPGTLWSWLADSAAQAGLTEPPLAVGALIDRLAVLTVERSRSGRLSVPHGLFIQHLTSGFGPSERTRIYVEGQNVAELNRGGQHAAVVLDGLIQRLFDSAQASAPAREVAQAIDELHDTRQRLLERLNALAAADEIAFAEDCPVCRAEALDDAPTPVLSLRYS